MPRTGERLHHHDRWRIRGEPAGCLVEGELEYGIAAERGRIDEAIALFDPNAVRVAARRDDLQRRVRDTPIVSDCADADEAARVRGSEEVATRLVERYVRHALGQRRCSDA